MTKKYENFIVRRFFIFFKFCEHYGKKSEKMKFFGQKLTHFSILDIYKCPNRVFESKIWRKFVTENLKCISLYIFVICYALRFIFIFLLGKI